jgi:hypothetical protein
MLTVEWSYSQRSFHHSAVRASGRYKKPSYNMVQQQGELQATGVFSSCIDILIARQKETGALKAVIGQGLISRKWIGGTISVHVMTFLRRRLRCKGNHHINFASQSSSIASVCPSHRCLFLLYVLPALVFQFFSRTRGVLRCPSLMRGAGHVRK